MQVTWRGNPETFPAFFFPCHTACRISVPWPGLEPGLWQWKCRILTARPSGNSQFFPVLRATVNGMLWSSSLSDSSLQSSVSPWVPAWEVADPVRTRKYQPWDPLQPGEVCTNMAMPRKSPWEKPPGTTKAQPGPRSRTEKLRLRI